jgi:hypothetical protein
MIVADKKPIEEIIDSVKDFRNILILGCNECVTVCEAGGKKEVGLWPPLCGCTFSSRAMR